MQKLRSYQVKVPEHQVDHGSISLEADGQVAPEASYHIATDKRHPLHFHEWLRRYPTDPAFQVTPSFDLCQFYNNFLGFCP